LNLRIPQSLAAQFTLAVWALALLIVAGGATAIYTLSASATAIRQLAEQRLTHLQEAQDLVQRTLLIERKALQLSGINTLAGIRETHRQVIEQLEAFDRLVDRLAAAAANDNVEVLDLHLSSQLFRNTVNIMAQLRESALSTETGERVAPSRNASTPGLDSELQRQAEALAGAATQQSIYFTRDYREAVQHMADVSSRTRWWVVGLVGVSLLLAWLITRDFLGRHVMGRLQQVSYYLRRGDSDAPSAGIPVQGRDEIADMARAVELFLEDRRQRKQAEQQLTAARDVAVAAQRAQATFLTNMSHELRTPLNAILGYAQLLRLDHNLTDRQASRLRTMQTSGEHLLALINDLLDLSRIEADKLELHPTAVDLPPFLQSIADTIRVKAAEKGLAFELGHSPDAAIVVRVDEQRLRQVLLNLLGNAVKFTDHGAISLRVAMLREPVDGELPLRFEVEDSGVGIAPQERDSLFQPFEQVGTVARRAGGSGLGLAISRQLVHLLGSDIHVDSRTAEGGSAHGSRFWFDLSLPLVSTPAAATSVPRDVIDYTGPRRRILVVDDVDANRRLFADCLQPLGFELQEAANGEEALAKAQLFQPDLILMDNAMPVMDGLEATRRLRSTPGLAAVPIIAISAAAYEQDQQVSLAAGANVFLAKPVEIAALRACIGTLLKLEWLER
jgi:signal transduction histidine kinase